jgi:hypothetical protein
MQSYRLHATDGEIGKIDDLYFDDNAWVIRYMVADTGAWLEHRRVLISPISVRSVNWETSEVYIALTRDQVKDAPDIDIHNPISRENELSFHRYYGWPFYWSGEGLWGGAMAPGALYGVPFVEPMPDLGKEAEGAPPIEAGKETTTDTHLHSTSQITGYGIQARDGQVGHLSDFLIDDESWRINYMVINTSNWWSGKKVILPPTWVKQINWVDGRITVDLKRETIKNSPELDPEAILSHS